MGGTLRRYPAATLFALALQPRHTAVTGKLKKVPYFPLKGADHPSGLLSIPCFSQFKTGHRGTLPQSAIMSIARKVLSILNPVANTEKDGRDLWPNRAAFILAAMVSCLRTFFTTYLSTVASKRGKC